MNHPVQGWVWPEVNEAKKTKNKTDRAGNQVELPRWEENENRQRREGKRAKWSRTGFNQIKVGWYGA